MVILCCALGLSGARVAAANTEAPSPTGRAEETNASPEMRSYLQLQEQLHATQLAVERTRREAEQIASQNAEALSGRMQGIEQSLAAQRAKELDAMQSSNRAMLIVAGSFAGIGFVAMLLMGYFQWRTVHRLAEISAIIPYLPGGAMALAGKRQLALNPAEAEVIASAPLASGRPQQVNVALLETIERLEKRVRELEGRRSEAASNGGSTKTLPLGGGADAELAEGDETEKADEQNGFNGQHTEAAPQESAATTAINELLVKGQTLLDMEQSDEALTCFDEALKLQPGHAEALVKKGTALEKMRRFDEAIQCYDRAIDEDSSMTIAYLYKGGLFNRMERFTEALQCYEKALQTQEARQR